MREPQITYPCKWVRAKKYEEMTGITVNAIKHKRESGAWIEGIHWVMAPDGNVEVCPAAIDNWVEGKSTGH